MLPTKFRFIWPSGFREDFKKITQSETRIAKAAMFVNGSGQNEQSLERIFHRCFLPSFTSFGWGVSEEKIKMWKVNRRRKPSDGKSSHCLWQGELKSINPHICTVTLMLIQLINNEIYCPDITVVLKWLPVYVLLNINTIEFQLVVSIC